MVQNDILHVKTWAAGKKLSESTVNELINLGFTSMDALSLLSPDDLIESEILIGQKRLLIKSVKETFPSTNRSTLCAEQTITTETTGVRSNSKVCSQLRGQNVPNMNKQYEMSSGSVSDINDKSHPPWLDPQVYLKAFNSDKVNYYDIVDFVFSKDRREDTVLLETESGQLIFRTGPPKPSLDSVTLCQWSLANLAICNKLIESGLLVYNSILDYLSYTTKIYQLFNVHERVSVLLYDREYRYLQSKFGFRWGTDVPHLSNIALIPREQAKRRKQTIKRRKVPNVHSTSHSKLDMNVCKQFNSKFGCSYATCKFSHVCNFPECGKLHSAIEHSQHTEQLNPKN